MKVELVRIIVWSYLVWLLALPTYNAEQSLSVCLSQHGPTAANPLLQVCCCEPGRQEMSIDRCTARSSAACSGRMRAVPHYSVRRKLTRDLFCVVFARSYALVLLRRPAFFEDIKFSAWSVLSFSETHKWSVVPPPKWTILCRVGR